MIISKPKISVTYLKLNLIFHINEIFNENVWNFLTLQFIHLELFIFYYFIILLVCIIYLILLYSYFEKRYNIQYCTPEQYYNKIIPII